jgi:cytochrome bd-type quinol oxidase subunit 2
MIKILAYIVGIIIFGWVGLYGGAIILENETGEKNKTKERKPTWLGNLCIIAGLFLLGAYIPAVNYSESINDFPLWLLSSILYYCVPIILVFLVFFCGYKIYKKTSNRVMALVVAVLLFFISVFIFNLISNFENINAKMDKIRENQEDGDVIGS